MGRTWLPLLLVPMGLGLLALAAVPRGVNATQLLSNPSFESWGGTAPTGWQVSGAATGEASGNAVSGQAVRVTGGDIIAVRQRVPAAAGARYEASVQVAGDPGTRASLQLLFEDDGFSEIGLPYTSYDTPVGSTFAVRQVSGIAPPGTARVVFTIRFSPGGGQQVEGFADEASLTMAAPPEPTSTPEATNTPTVVATSPTDPATAPATSTATSGGGSGGQGPASTPSVPATIKATASRTGAPPAGGGGGGYAGTPTKVPTLPPTSTPTRPAGPGSGQSEWELVNGGFELASEGKPHYWNKYGGTIGLEGAAFEGHHAATLTSETDSTKWIYQAVRVNPGTWYEAAAVGRVSIGSGEVFIRLSWYESEDGTGTAIEHADSESTASRSWQRLTVRAQAPGAANSVRVRLVLRPGGHCMGAFDAVTFAATSAPAQAAEPTATAPATAAAGTTPGAATKTATTAGGGSPVAEARVAGVTVDGPEGSPVRISEVLSDPEEAGRDSAFEWVELVNTGLTTVHLGGWQIGDARGLDALPSHPLAPGAYVVVAGKSARLPANIAVLHVVDGEIGSGLNNAGDTVRLLAPGGAEADAVSFGDDTSVFEPPPPAPASGKSVGVYDPAATRSGSNWALTDRPSPGESNSFAMRPAPASIPGGTPPAAGAALAPLAAPASVERGNPSSAVPWILLGGAAGAGLLGLGNLARRAAPAMLDRWKR